MLILKPSHIFRQAQYDSPLSQSEPVEDFAAAITFFIKPNCV